MTKITQADIDGLSEQDANTLLDKYGKAVQRNYKREEELRKIIGMLHARLDQIAKTKSPRNGRQ